MHEDAGRCSCDFSLMVIGIFSVQSETRTRANRSALRARVNRNDTMGYRKLSDLLFPDPSRSRKAGYKQNGGSFPGFDVMNSAPAAEVTKPLLVADGFSVRASARETSRVNPAASTSARCARRPMLLFNVPSDGTTKAFSMCY
jgi:hypothetical protein